MEEWPTSLFSNSGYPLLAWRNVYHFSQMIMLTHFYRIANSSLLGAFAKPREANISFVVSVLPSLRMERTRPPWTDLHEI